MATRGDQEWLWYSLGAAACVVGSVIFGTAAQRGRDSHHRTSSIRLEDIKVDQFTEDEAEVGADIIRRLRAADWHLETIKFFDDLDFEHVTDLQLRALTGEWLVAIEKDILSINTACVRFRSRKRVVRLFKELLKVYKAAIPLLKTFAHDVLKVKLDRHEPSAEAQSYSHCLSFLTTHGSCAEIVGAIAVNFPVRWLACGKLRDGLYKSKTWSKEQMAFADTLAQPVPKFNELALGALNEALFQDIVSGWKTIERNGKVLQDSEKLFWNSLMKKRKKLPEPSEVPSVIPCEEGDEYWKDVNITRLPTLSGVLPHFATPIKREERKISLQLKNASSQKKNSLTLATAYRSTSVPSKLYLDRVASMSPAEVNSEIEEMKRHMRKISTNFNALQDDDEAKSHSVESSSLQHSGLQMLQDIELSSEAADNEEEFNKPDECKR